MTDWLIELVSRENNPAGLAILAGSAAIEYVFPPFPGDTITLFGSVLITAYGWSFAGVFGSVLAGSVAGSMLAFTFGQRLDASLRRRPASAKRRRARLERLVEGFRKHGAAYLAINRFLPGIRALFFVAAGMAGMRRWQVALYSALSAALWNLAVIAVGSALGANFDTLRSWASTYAIAVWIVLGAIAAALLVRAWIRTYSGSSGDEPMSPRRKRVITVLFGLFVLAHVSGLVTRDQHWPFSSFPMFSFNMEEGLSCPVVFGVPEDASKPEIRIGPMHTGTAFLTMPYAFAKMLRYPERHPSYDALAAECPGDAATKRGCVSEKLAQRALAFLYKRYQMRAKKAAQAAGTAKGKPPGQGSQAKKMPPMPPLRAMRVYDVHFAPSPTPKVFEVDSKTLRAEWAPAPEGGQ